MVSSGRSNLTKVNRKKFGSVRFVLSLVSKIFTKVFFLRLVQLNIRFKLNKIQKNWLNFGYFNYFGYFGLDFGEFG